MITDKEKLWVSRMKNKDEDALFEVIKHYGSWVQAIISRRLAFLPEEQDECLNDTFFKVWEQIDKYDPSKGSFKNWIGAIASYMAIDTYRRVSKTISDLPLDDDSVSTSNSPESMLLQKEYEKQLFSLLDGLNEMDRKIFIQLFFNEKSYEDVANELSVNKNYLYNRVSRGRKTLFDAKGDIL